MSWTTERQPQRKDAVKTRAQEVGEKAGRAIARDVIAEDLPRGWPGLDTLDYVALTGAGFQPNTPEWQEAERAAHTAYLDVMAKDSAWAAEEM